jgi:hypothetical protein
MEVGHENDHTSGQPSAEAERDGRGKPCPEPAGRLEPASRDVVYFAFRIAFVSRNSLELRHETI